jgi:hypothetical protein
MRPAHLVAVVLAAVVGCLPQSLASGEEAKPAPPETFTRFKPDDLATIVRDAGYRAEVDTENNRPRIRAGMAGYNVVIYLYQCTDDGTCGSLQYSVGLTKSPNYTLTLVNKWNEEKRYAKAYLDKNGNMYLEYDLSFSGGITRETVKAAARLFDDLAADFRTMLSAASK